MQEILSMTLDPMAPLSMQEFYQLSLIDEVSGFRTRYRVRQVHVGWSELDGQIIWGREETDSF